MVEIEKVEEDDGRNGWYRVVFRGLPKHDGDRQIIGSHLSKKFEGRVVSFQLNAKCGVLLYKVKDELDAFSYAMEHVLPLIQKEVAKYEQK